MGNTGTATLPPETLPIEDGEVRLTLLCEADGPQIIAANRDSRDYHAPFVVPCRDEEAFAAWLEAAGEPANRSLVARRMVDGALVGVINLTQIARGNFCSAYMGYHGYAATAGQGLMTRALRLGLRHVFDGLGLHRVEANIQPGNLRSIALIRRVGFRKEGYSPRYLKIAGEWRDHERWALTAEDWTG